MTLPWPTFIRVLAGAPMPTPRGRIPGRLATRLVVDDLDPAEVDARELARLLGVTRQAADQRLQRARASGDVAQLLALAIARTTSTGATPATTHLPGAGAAATDEHHFREKDPI